MRTLTPLLSVHLLLACASARGAPPGDPVLRAMEDELARSRDNLHLPGYESPYFLALIVEQTEQIELSAKHGALFVDAAQRRRSATADVRVGSYDTDSSDDPDWEWVDEGVYVPTDSVALDDDVAALRHTLWQVTDFRYKQALASYLELKGQGVHALAAPDRGPSFSPAPPVRSLAAPMALALDRDRWRDIVRSLSRRLSDNPQIFDAEVRLEALVETRWLVSSEGTRLRTVQPVFALHASASTRADDGMQIDHALALYAPSERALPAVADLEREIDHLSKILSELRAAPLLEPYTGPAILSPVATGVLFHEVIGHRLEGNRQADSDGQTFSRYLGQPILPDFLSLLDDPTRSHLGPIPLNGHYAFDDEGVAAEPVTLVDRGVLRAFLSARRPAPGAKRSNGHGRAQGTRRPVARQGNLIVLAHAPVAASELKARLLAEVRKAGKPFGLIVRDLAGGQTNTSSYGYQAFKGEARTVYKVDAESGHETLVRGVDLVGTPLTTIGKIIAAGDTPGVFNGYCGAESGMVPVSVVAPAILISEVELQRSARPRTRPPILTNPLHLPPNPRAAPPPPENAP